MTSLGLMAQEGNKKRQEVDYDSPTFVPMVKVGKVLENGDSIQYMEMNNVYVYPPIAFSSKKQQMAYNRLVKNVKIVLPIAKEARKIMMETAEYLETLPDKNAKEAHMKLVERSIMKEYKPRMKKLTFSQGKLLIKLIYRESNSSGYGVRMGLRRKPEETIRPGRGGPSDGTRRADGGGGTDIKKPHPRPLSFREGRDGRGGSEE